MVDDPDLASLSARRAWIEIISPDIRADVYSVALRKESVDRNFHNSVALVPHQQSLSARRAWIEMLMGALTTFPA